VSQRAQLRDRPADLSRPAAGGHSSALNDGSANFRLAVRAIGDLRDHVLVHQVLLALATLSLFGGGFNAWMSIVQLRSIGIGAVCLLGATLLVLLVTVAATTARALVIADGAVLLLGVLTVVLWSASHLYFNPGYGTDEAAFVQYGGSLLLHGADPYSHSMLPALTTFHVPIEYATYTLDGHVSTQFAYPSLPLYAVIPFIWLTHGVQSAIVENVFFLAITTVVTFFLLPRIFRPLSVLVMIGLPILFGYTMSGMNDLLLLPFLVVVAHKWNEVGDGSVFRRRDALQAVAFGFALSVKPLAWFIAPFLILAIWQICTRRSGARTGTGITMRYTATAITTAALLNAPFMIWGFGAWFRGVLAPIQQHAVPYGQGLVDLSLFFGIGGGNIGAYTTAAAFLLVAALAAQSRFFPLLGRAALVTPALILFFPSRSLAAYFMTLLPVWIVSLVTCRNSAFAFARLRGRGARRFLSAVVAVSLIAAAAFLGVAAATPGPLALHVESVQTNGQLQGVWQIHVSVRNRSSQAVTPHFATNSFGQVTTFWHLIRGPKTLGPSSTAEYVLDAPNLGSMPGITTPFLLQAVTDHPETVSSAPLYIPQPYSAYLIPDYVNRIVKLGHSIKFAVQLRSPYGGAVHEQGVRLALGQLIYGQADLIPAEARIDKGNIGQSPVYARTNRAGRARFTVRSSTRANGNAIYFQSWIAPQKGYPFGYSEIVDVSGARASAVEEYERALRTPSPASSCGEYGGRPRR
jgi:uncharacterized membrane protein